MREEESQVHISEVVFYTEDEWKDIIDTFRAISEDRPEVIAFTVTVSRGPVDFFKVYYAESQR